MALLDEVQRDKAEAQSVQLRTVFLYPWKYHSWEEVWRGLVLTPYLLICS